MNASRCRFCRYYQLTGRRGGQCLLLDVSVKGEWPACQASVSFYDRKLSTEQKL